MAAQKRVAFTPSSPDKAGTSHHQRTSLMTLLCLILFFSIVMAGPTAEGAERFYISIPGPTLSYVPFYYAQERGFFTEEGLDVQVLVVRGIIGVSSLLSGEIDLTCHAGSGFSAILRGIPLKIVSVTRDRLYTS